MEKEHNLEDALAEQCETVSIAEADEEKIREDERKFIRKFDLLVLPLLSGSIFFAYLDRSQIGNARILGLEEDLGLSNQQFYNCLMLFYVGYMSVELPAGILLRVCHPRYVIGGASLCFGLFAACMAAVPGYGALAGLRTLVGLAEGIGYCVYLYTSLWYKPYELARRTAAVFGMSPIAGAVSGLIAYGVGRTLDGDLGYTAWQWLFIIEGVLTIAFGLIVLVLLPPLPDIMAAKGHFLFRKKRDREVVARRSKTSHNDEGSKPRYNQILVGLKDPKVWLCGIMNGGLGMCIGGFGVFLPTFINQFGFSPLETQLYSIIPYAFGFVALVVVGFLSDHIRHKAFIAFGCYCVILTGLIILLTTTNRVALVAGLCFVLTGVYPGTIMTLSLLISMHGGFLKRATAIWISQVFIQGFSIMATQVYTDPPRYFKGHGITMGLCVLSQAGIVCLYFIMSRANKNRDRRAEEFAARGETDPLMEKDFEELCDFHPAWRYAL